MKEKILKFLNKKGRELIKDKDIFVSSLTHNGKNLYIFYIADDLEIYEFYKDNFCVKDNKLESDNWIIAK